MGLLDDIINSVRGPLEGLMYSIRDNINNFVVNLTEMSLGYFRSFMWWFENLNGKINNLSNKINSVQSKVEQIPRDIYDDLKEVRDDIKNSSNMIYREVSNVTIEQLKKTNALITNSIDGLKEQTERGLSALDQAQKKIRDDIENEFLKQQNALSEVVEDVFEKLKLDEIFQTLANIGTYLLNFTVLFGRSMEFLYENRETIGRIFDRIWELIVNAIDLIMNNQALFTGVLIVFVLLFLRISYNLFMIFVVGKFI